MKSQTKLKIRFPELLLVLVLVFASYQLIVQIPLWLRKANNRVDIGGTSNPT